MATDVELMLAEDDSVRHEKLLTGSAAALGGNIVYNKYV